MFLTAWFNVLVPRGCVWWSLSLWWGDSSTLFPERRYDYAMFPSSQKGKTRSFPMAWLDSKPLGQRSYTVSNNLPAPSCLIFPAEHPESYCSCSCNAQIPETLGLTPVDLLQPHSFCKTVSGTLVSLGDITDVPKQNHQQRPSFSGCHPLLQQETKWTSLGFRERAEPIRSLTLPWEYTAEHPFSFPHTHQGLGPVGMKDLCGSEKPTSWQKVPPVTWQPNVFPTPASLPARFHLSSCHFVMCLLIPSCAEAPPSTIRQRSSPQTADSQCLQKHAPSLGDGRGEVFSSVPNTHTHTPTLIVFPARLLQLQGKLPEPTEQLLARTTHLQGPKPICGSVPQPLHSQTFSISHRCCSANQRPGCRSQQTSKGKARKEEDSEAGSPSGLSIPLSKEQHCLTRCLTSTGGTSHYLPDGGISRTNLYLQLLYLPTLVVEQFSITKSIYISFSSLGDLSATCWDPSALSWNFRYLLASLRWRRPLFCSCFTKELWKDSLLGALLLSCLLKKWHWNWGWGQMLLAGTLGKTK